MHQSEFTGPSPSRGKWVALSTYAVAHATTIIGAMVLGILLPSMTEELGLSPPQQGWLGSSALIGSLLVSLPFGWWLSRYNAKMTTTITLAVGALLVFAQGWAPTFAVLLAARLLFGLTVVARDPARALLVHQWLRGREVLLFNGLLNAVFGVALTVGFVATPFVLKAFDGDWRDTTYSYAVVNGAMVLAWVLLGRENISQSYRRRVASQAGTPLQSLFKYKEPWLVGLGMVGYSVAQMAQLTFWPTFMKETYGMSLVESGFLIGILGLVVASGGIVVVPVLSKAGGNRLPLVALGVAMSGTFLGLLLTDLIPVLAVMFLVNGLTRGAFWTIFNTVPFELPGSTPRETAVAQSLMMTMFWAGGVLGPILVGFLHEATADLELAMVVSSLFPLGISLTAVFLPGKVRQEQVEIS
ncbi:MAG: MFS transporter [Dehalococcoidia bacterium]